MKHKLDDIGKKEFYKVPDGYFEKLPLDIRKKVETKNQTPFYRFNIRPVWLYSLIFIVSAGIFFLSQRYSSSTDSALSLDDYTDSELVEFMVNEGVSLSEIVQNTSSTDVLFPLNDEEEYLLEDELLYDIEWYEDTSSNEI